MPYIILSEHYTLGVLPDLRLVFFYPHQLGQGPDRVGTVQDMAVYVSAPFTLQIRDLIGRARVGPVDRRAQDIVVIVAEHRGVRRRVERDRRDIMRVDMALFEYRGDILSCRRIPVERILFGVPGARVGRGVFDGVRRGDTAVRREQCSLRRAAAEINSECVVHFMACVSFVPDSTYRVDIFLYSRFGCRTRGGES